MPHVILLLVSPSCHQGVSWLGYEEVLAGTCSQLIHTVGSIHFLLSFGLRPLFPCWLSAGSHPKLLEVSSGICTGPPISQSQQSSIQTFPCLETLCLLLLPDLSDSSQRKLPTLKASCEYNGLT